MQSKRIVGYDLIRVVAAFMVVAIHSNVCYLSPCDGSINWFVAMQFTALCVVSVPLFFMVSGAVNIGREQTTSIHDLYKRKLPRLLIPFIVWSCIYVVVRMAVHKIPVSIDGFVSLLWEPAYYQFWFIYSLIGMYLCIPFFQFLIQTATKQTLLYILVLWLVFSVVLPVALRYIPGFRISGHSDMVFLEGYWGYFFLGGYLHKYPLANSKTTGLILVISGFAITAICSVLEWYFSHSYYGYVYCAYLLPGAVMASVGIFCISQKINNYHPCSTLIYYLASISMGIYYMHMLILVAEDTIFNDCPRNIIFMIGKWVIACVSTSCLCSLVYKIPIAKKFLF